MSQLIFIDNIKVFGNFMRCMIHAAVPYMVTYSAMWPFDDKGSYFFDFAIFEGHLFLMELFFILTGYMFALQLSKKSISDFIVNRLKKIVIPFSLCLLLIMPLVLTYFNLKNYNTFEWLEPRELLISYQKGWKLALENFFPTGHLWFLYYLILFYIISLTFYRYLPKILKTTEKLSFWLLIFSTIIISIFCFYFMKRWLVDNPLTLLPEIPSFVYYFLFFFLGILFFNSQKFTNVVQKNKTRILIIGIILGIFAIVPQLFFEKKEIPNYQLIKFIAIVLHVFASYFLTLGIWSHFSQKKERKKNNLVAYLSDANYWIYITFLPTAMFIQLCLLPFSFSIFFKFFITYSLGISFCLITYEFFVRYTWIGTLLNRKNVRNKG